tara:strand:+ start:17 stop:628 length:612 start_codon:yes stop_codon:yes gene_type:complete
MSVSSVKTGVTGISALAGNALYDPNDFYLLERVTLSASASSVSFAGIPSGYKHLQIRMLAQSNYAYPVDDAYIRFNGISTNTYDSHSLQGNGASAYAGSAISTTSAQIAYGTVGTTSGNQTTSSWGAFVVDILDYKNENKNTTIRTLSGNDCNGTGNAGLGGRVGLTSGLWRSGDAVNQIEIICALGARNFQQYSSFALYGVK